LSSNNLSLSKFKFISPNKICKTNSKPSQSQNCLLSHLLHGFQVRERRDERWISGGDWLLHAEVSDCEETRRLAFIPETGRWGGFQSNQFLGPEVDNGCISHQIPIVYDDDWDVLI
ncbi:hypothetical protein M8C21_023118, partial [Ambrosia artemisiifolia]